MVSGTTIRTTIDFETHADTDKIKIIKIKRRRATKIEELSLPVPEPSKPKTNHVARLDRQIGPLGVIQSFQYADYQWPRKNETTRNKECTVCRQTAKYIAYFELNEAQLIERYCPDCLDKCVILPVSPNLGNIQS